MFAWNARRWANAADFIISLHATARPDYLKRIVIHHTWSPLLSEWRGMASMVGLERYYRDQVKWTDAHGATHYGWSAGPHLFVAWGSQRAEWDGIFQGTPITESGIHAGTCNSDSLGIEVVGNYDLAPWSAALEVVLVEVVSSLLRWANIGPASVIGHRDCGSPKTCPGKMIDLDAFRRKLVLNPADPWALWGSDFSLPLEQRGWDVAQRWSARRQQLGRARSFPLYAGDGRGTVIQVFAGGVVVDRDGSPGKALTWDELLS